MPDASALVTDLVAYAQRKGLQPADAHDIAQEVAARLLANRADLDGHDRRAWAYRVAQRLMVDRGRAKTRRDALHAQVAPLLTEHAPDPAEMAAYADALALAVRALAALPERDQQVIRLLDIEGASGSQAAAALGVSLENLRQIHRRARRRLRKEYLGLGGAAAGMALLFPSLRGAHRVRMVAAAAVLPVALALTGLGVIPHLTTWNEARPAPDGYVPPSFFGPPPVGLPPVARALTTVVARTLTSDGRPERAGLVVPLVPHCEPTDPDIPALCYGKDEAHEVGIAPPGPLAPLGTTVTMDEADPGPLCPVVTTIPYAVCR